MKAWAEILGGIGLAIAAEPIHEGGHAIATRMVTGVWPKIGFWAVHPTSGFASKLDALIVLAAGDLAVLIWWTAIFLLVYHRPKWKWGVGRTKPDDGYRSGHLVRIRGADAFGPC
jgi:hypothetical protein